MTETGSHASIGAVIGPVAGKGTGERSAAAELAGLLDPGMLLMCDRGLYSFELWCAAADTGAQLLWRLGDIMKLPVVASCGDGSYLTLLYHPRTSTTQRAKFLGTARAGGDLTDHADRVRIARVVEYEVTDRGSGDLICLLSTMVEPRRAPAALLADTYHQRWVHETANREIKQQLRGPGKIQGRVVNS
jgi:hypothetical protein